MMQFIGKWGGVDENMTIKKNGQFTMKYGAQTIRGDGKFEEIDGILHFIVETKC
jgi:hypothetical protein